MKRYRIKREVVHFYKGKVYRKGHMVDETEIYHFPADILEEMVEKEEPCLGEVIEVVASVTEAPVEEVVEEEPVEAAPDPEELAAMKVSALMPLLPSLSETTLRLLKKADSRKTVRRAITKLLK